jgi:hypothetical protein
MSTANTLMQLFPSLAKTLKKKIKKKSNHGRNPFQKRQTNPLSQTNLNSLENPQITITHPPSNQGANPEAITHARRKTSANQAPRHNKNYVGKARPDED